MQANLSGIRNNIERVVANHKELLAGKKTLPDLEIVNNEDWYRDMNVMTFMGKVGRRLRISRMLGRFESIFSKKVMSMLNAEHDGYAEC